MKQRSKWLGTSLLIPALLLTACAPERDAQGVIGGDSTGGDPGKPESLSIWTSDLELAVEAYGDITEQFTEETGIEVNLRGMTIDEQTEGMSLDGPGGRGPDLFFQPHDRIGDIALQGLAVPIDITEEQRNQYEEAALDAMTYEGELYGLPAVQETYALYYNKSITETPPETLEELETLAQEETDASQDEYGFLMEGINFYFTYPFMTAFGGYVFGENEDGTYNIDDIGLNEAGAVEGAEMLQSWFDEGYLPRGVNADIMNGLFEEGNVGAVVSGPWSLRDYQQALGEDNLGVAPLPTTDEGEALRSFSGVQGWLVSSFIDVERRYWAEELAFYMTNEESSTSYVETTGHIPGNKAVVESDLIQEDPFLSGFAEQVRRSEAMPNPPEINQVWDPMEDAQQFISEGDDAEEVLNEAVEEINVNIEMQAPPER
ncbi:extracellular solute-binding protein [Sinobaca sp. H24]|uniref:sugar ABC transporter substrate-binding protein n=1 Tax=Sinobaca sp. H24 TaxID=2923376 RepID=UPI00207AD73B|nr:extracellular solute-binding protein [Sinobaca sp. H24]